MAWPRSVPGVQYTPPSFSTRNWYGAPPLASTAKPAYFSHVGHFILLRQFMDGRIERSDWTGEEAILRPGAYFPDPDIESEWIVTKRPHAIEGEGWPVFVIDQIRSSTTPE